MARSDRAFHALAHAQPEAVAEALRVLAPGVLPADSPVTLDDLAVEKLDALPPQSEADWVVRTTDDTVVHVECQGYRDTGFAERVQRYHLALSVRHWPRRVETVALWLIVPPEGQRLELLQHHTTLLTVTQVVVPRVAAATLLANPRTAWLAPAADAGELRADELCRQVARSLRRTGASWYEQHMAVIAAVGRGRYNEMVKAMHEESFEPIIIEDLVLFGEDRGLEKGRSEGLGLLVRLLAWKLGRPVEYAERSALVARLATLGPERLGDIVLDLAADELAAWLADPAAR